MNQETLCRATSSKTCEHNIGIDYFIVGINLCSCLFVLLFILSDWLISPRQFSDAGAVGGLMADLVLPPPSTSRRVNRWTDYIRRQCRGSTPSTRGTQQRIHTQRPCCQYQQCNQPGDRPGGSNHGPPGPADPRGQHRRFYPPAHGNRPVKTN